MKLFSFEASALKQVGFVHFLTIGKFGSSSVYISKSFFF
jgi:hypothetical protein